MEWKQYQEDVAALLRSLGFTATVEAKVKGARGTHSIDVHAVHTAYGFPITWIVECKYWNRAVPKEKVLVLAQIAADVGADRGFLLSESGFQSGAILAAQNTNITLISLPDLRQCMGAELGRLGLSQIAQRAYTLEKRAQGAFFPGRVRRADGLGERFLELLARLFALKTVALPSAQAEKFPVQLFDGKPIADLPLFLSAASTELECVASELDVLLKELTQPSPQVPKLAEAFVDTVNEFLDAAHHAMAASSTEEHQERCMVALTPMRRIGEQADALRFMLQANERKALGAVMRALGDGPYLLIMDRSTEASAWSNASGQVTELLDGLVKEVHSARRRSHSAV